MTGLNDYKKIALYYTERGLSYGKTYKYTQNVLELSAYPIGDLYSFITGFIVILLDKDKVVYKQRVDTAASAAHTFCETAWKLMNK